MAIVKVMLAIWDCKARAYIGDPLWAPTRGVGERSFTDLVNNKETVFFAHPDDFELHEVGEFDIETGVVKAVEGRPVVYGKARNFLREA